MRKFCIGFALLLAVWLLSGAPVQAQSREHRLEFDPFVGYETRGSFPVIDSTFQVPNGDRLRANGGRSYGTFIDYSLTRSAQAEFSWHRSSPMFSERIFPSTVYVKAFDSNIDEYQFGLLYILRSDEHKIRPYIAGGLGFAHRSNSGANPSSTNFAYNLGGGVKYMFTSHFGLRADARYVPIRENSSIRTVCNPFGFCFNARVGNYLNRGNFTAGFVFQF